ncbi:MAG: hypothetical protein R2710_04645 [Acidimicrobiales bacterium]
MTLPTATTPSGRTSVTGSGGAGSRHLGPAGLGHGWRGAVTAVGTLTVGTLALVTTPVVLAALPVVAGAGVLTSRLVFRPTVRRVRNELDYTADQIARGKEAPSLLGDLATPITDRLRRR